jgi:hypothetical protein
VHCPPQLLPWRCPLRAAFSCRSVFSTSQRPAIHRAHPTAVGASSNRLQATPVAVLHAAGFVEVDARYGMHRERDRSLQACPMSHATIVYKIWYKNKVRPEFPQARVVQSRTPQDMGYRPQQRSQRGSAVALLYWTCCGLYLTWCCFRFPFGSHSDPSPHKPYDR